MAFDTTYHTLVLWTFTLCHCHFISHISNRCSSALPVMSSFSNSHRMAILLTALRSLSTLPLFEESILLGVHWSRMWMISWIWISRFRLFISRHHFIFPLKMAFHSHHFVQFTLAKVTDNVPPCKLSGFTHSTSFGLYSISRFWIVKRANPLKFSIIMIN